MARKSKKDIKELHKHFSDYVENYLHVKRMHAKLKWKPMGARPKNHILKLAKHLDNIHKNVQRG